MSYLISVPAGRAFRRENSKWVDPQPEKGLIQMKLEDDLMQLSWKSRETNRVEDELIIFLGEATFEKVPQDPTGRTHILKFSSSNQKYFFWFQRLSKEGDLRAQVDINELLQDPSYQPGSAALPTQQLERDWPPTPGAPRLTNPQPAPAANADVGSSSNTDTGRENMARLLAEWARGGALGQPEDDARLTDVLSPSNISALISSDPALISTITPLLPPGLSLPENPTPEPARVSKQLVGKELASLLLPIHRQTERSKALPILVRDVCLLQTSQPTLMACQKMEHNTWQWL